MIRDLSKLDCGFLFMLEPLPNHHKTVCFSEDFYFAKVKTFPSLYRECNDVKTRKSSEKITV